MMIHRHRKAPMKGRPSRFRLHFRRFALLFILGLIAGIGGWFLVRGSSLVQASDVTVRGIRWGDRAAIRQTVVEVAHTMTTLHPEKDELLTALERYPSVSDVTIQSNFPHRMTVVVAQYEPVAVVEVGGRKKVSDRDGRLLSDLTPNDTLPVLKVQGATKRKVTNPKSIAALAIAAAVSPAVRARIAAIRTGTMGLEVTLENGPRVIFGDQRRARAKWQAALRVLGDEGSVGAKYIDVRVPDRVAVGGVTSASTSRPTLPATTPVPTATVVPTATPTPTVTPVPYTQP